MKSILLYNCGTWALTLLEEERLNTHHRKQLKKILNIRYPKKIKTNHFIENLPRKVTVINSIRSLESLWSYSTKRQKTFLQIKQQELLLSLMVTNCEDDQRQPCQ